MPRLFVVGLREQITQPAFHRSGRPAEIRDLFVTVGHLLDPLHSFFEMLQSDQSTLV